MDKIKITGTKWYTDIEFKGNIARFGGELCTSSFCAMLNSGQWIKHTGNNCDEDMKELLSEVVKHNQDKNNKFKVHFFDENNNQVI